MSGVFGVADARQRPCAALLQRAADSLQRPPWAHVQTWTDERAGVGLGQANVGLFSSDPQPLHLADAALSVVFFGELYYTGPLRSRLAGAGCRLSGPSEETAAELAGRLYQIMGADFVCDLEGVFVLALWDARRRRLLLANDRFGLLPTYYAHYDGRLLFAPEVKGILADPAFGRQLDLTGVAQFFRFQRLLGQRTFFEGLHLLPHGSLLRFDPEHDALSVTRYWDFDRIPAQPVDLPFEDAVQETGRLLRRAVEERTRGPQRVGVYLSGGLDSRTLLGLASQLRPPITSLTYGVPGCRDAYYAKRIARHVKSPHHFFVQTDGRWMQELAATHLEVTEGLTTWVHGHAGSTLAPARELMDVNLSGHSGDQLLGGRALEYAPLLLDAPDDLAFDCHTFYYLNQKFCWPGITEAEERSLYTPRVYAQMDGRAWDSLREEMAWSRGRPYAQRWELFVHVAQGTRLSNLNVVYQRAFFEARYPFSDYALVDFVYTLPAAYRLHDRLYLAVLSREVPEVTWVPRDSNEQLPTDRRWLRQAHHLGNRIYRRATGRHLGTLHDDPEGWLRRDLRGWAEDLLFDRRTLERGLFDPAFVRSIVARHMSGRELHTIGKIAPLITFEMMLRRFYD